MYSFSSIEGRRLMRDTTGRGGGIFLLVLQFPFFLGIKFRLLAFFFIPFVFTASVGHSCFLLDKWKVGLIGESISLFIKKGIRRGGKYKKQKGKEIKRKTQNAKRKT